MKNQNLITRYLIIECALKKRFVTYTELVKALKLPFNLTLTNDRVEFGKILGAISKSEHERGLPLLSSLVVDATKFFPGDGFFGMASKDLDLLSENATKTERILFAYAEQLKCFKFWKFRSEQEPGDTSDMKNELKAEIATN